MLVRLLRLLLCERVCGLNLGLSSIEIEIEILAVREGGGDVWRMKSVGEILGRWEVYFGS